MPVMQDTSDSEVVQSFPSQVLNSATTTLGRAVDTSGFDSVMWILDVGTLVGSGCKVAAKIVESETESGVYTDVPGAAFADVTGSNDEATYKGVARTNVDKPWQKASITTSGTVTSAPVCCAPVLQNPRKLCDGVDSFVA